MIPVRVLAVRYLANASPALCSALGAPKGFPSLGLITTDCDDATYIALDAATKAAEVEVAYGRSFYAGAGNASTPNAGEVIGILAGQTPGAVRSGMEAALAALSRVGFEDLSGVPCLSCTVSSVRVIPGKGGKRAPGHRPCLPDRPAAGKHVRPGRGVKGGGCAPGEALRPAQRDEFRRRAPQRHPVGL